jgi:hypothetical protein
MKTLGGWIAGIALVVGVLVLAVFDTSVPTRDGTGRIHNIGLMNEKQNLLLVTAAIGVAGIVMFAMGARSGRANSAPDPSTDPPASRASVQGAVADSAFDERWETLTKYDQRFEEALKMVAAYGPAAIRELKRAFRAVDDPAQIGKIAQKVIADAQSGTLPKATDPAEATNERLMQKHGIIFVDGYYNVDGQRFATLQEAWIFATRKRGSAA